MIRLRTAILLALPFVLAATLSSAQAQPAPRNGAGSQSVPPGSFLYDDGDYVPQQPGNGASQAPQQVQRGPQWLPGYRDADEPLSPPGFASQGGHQMGAASPDQPAADNDDVMRPPRPVGNAQQATPPAPADTAALPPEDQPETGQPKELPDNLKRQLVDYSAKEPAGTIIIDTAHTYLYLVLGGGKALRYGIGVGREGFTWAGTERVSRMKEWPDWFPPPEMIDRQPYLPRMMAGGPGNPLGARALYLGNTLYRIHGTNQPSTIGQYVSSGCIRLLNEDIEDLYSRVQVGTRVVVLPGKAPETVANTGAAGASATKASVMVEPDPDSAGTSGSTGGIVSRPLASPR